MLGLVRHTWAYWTFPKITKVPISLGKVELFCLFVVCSYTSMEAMLLSCHFRWLWSWCPKFSETTNHQYLWKGFSDFVDFLHVVICILLDIHWCYKNMLFRVDTVRHRLSGNQIVRCFKLKNLKNYMSNHVDVLLPLKLQKRSCYFGLWTQKTLGQSNIFQVSLKYLHLFIPETNFHWFIKCHRFKRLAQGRKDRKSHTLSCPKTKN